MKMAELLPLNVYPFTLIFEKSCYLIKVPVCLPSQKEITSQTDYYLVIMSSKTFVFEDKLTKY